MKNKVTKNIETGVWKNMKLYKNSDLIESKINYEHTTWYKLKLTLRPPCFVVEIFSFDGVLDTTFKVPIITKIYMCKIQDKAVIIISKNKPQNDFLTPCTMRQHGGWKKYQKIDVSLDWNCTANKRSTVEILDILRIYRESYFSRTPNF